jgi:hypothetical protein
MHYYDMSGSDEHIDTQGMLAPVRCNYCGRVYDLCSGITEDPKTGNPYGRYADCTVYMTPCCRKVVDDRKWVSFPAFTEIKQGG